MTKVNKSIGHDRMQFTATFPNRDRLKFNISRSSDSIRAVQVPSNVAVTQEEFNTIAKWLKLGKDETHMNRYDRLEAKVQNVSSIQGLALILSLE